MAYTKRLDGRKNDELRPMTAKVGAIKNADGSAYFKIGNTECFAAVYGPKELHPKFLQNPKKGLIRCHYNMLPFSGCGSRIRPGNKRRSQEISMVIAKALEPVVDLSSFPNSVVDIFIEFPQTDAGTRCAAISAASMALADAGIRMKEMVSSVAMGEVDGTVVADLTYNEEAYDAIVSDIPIAMVNSTQEITLLQMDGEITKKALIKALNAAKDATAKVYEVQEKALKTGFEPVKAKKKTSAAKAKKEVAAEGEE